MQLLLIDDLPLFRTDAPPDTAEAVRAAIGARHPGLTRELMPYPDLRRWWSGVAAATTDAAVLVGTRPALLHRRHPLAAATVHTETVVRRHAADGRTAGAVTTSARPPRPAGDGSICVVDDVAMSGRTVRAVLDLLGDQPAPGGVTVRLAVATHAALRLNAAHRHAPRCEVDRRLDFEPVTGGTVIFLHDLLFGELRGRPFLEQEHLLAPFFPEGVTAWRELAGHIGARQPDGVAR